MNTREAQSLAEIVALLELGRGLAGKSDKEIGVDLYPRGLDDPHSLDHLGPGAALAQALEDVVGTRLQAEIDRQVSLDEAAVLAILQKEIKIRREALEEARQANRPDLVAEAEAEITVVNAFLPQAFSADELKALAEAAIAEAGAASPADMGMVMKLLMPRIQGRAPGDQVSQLVRQLLQK